MMKQNKLTKAVCVALISAGAMFSAPQASAQLLGLGVNTDARVGVQVGRAPEPRRHSTYSFTYNGYSSGHWYEAGHTHRAHHYDPYYGGYDCHTRFQYGWQHGERVRYESTFCYDRYDRAYERSGTRVAIRID